MRSEHNFNAAVRNYYNIIYNYCYKRLCDRHAAEDCTQEVFLILYIKMNRSEMSGNVCGWLYRTADRVMKNYCKNIKRSSVPECDEAEELSYYDSYNEEPPFKEILNCEELEIITAYYLNGEDIISLSARLGKTEAAMYKRLQRIRRKIKKHIDKIDNNGG